jgi:hypothetical protein
VKSSTRIPASIPRFSASMTKTPELQFEAGFASLLMPAV